MDRQLVQRIAAEVLAVLQQRGSVTHAEDLHAEIHPPVGTCTGDYSKFAELSGRQIGAAFNQTNDAMAATDHNTPLADHSETMAPLPLTGVVTASQLERAIANAAEGVVVLAVDARLTPLASDFVREHGQKVRRLSASEAHESRLAARSTLPWMWWVDGGCPNVEKTVQSSRDRLVACPSGPRGGDLAQVIRNLAAAIRTKQVAGGVLFVSHAARAMCFANRCLSLRAVLGTCDEVVEQGISDLGANVLVLEYPLIGDRAMSALVRRFTEQPPRVPAVVERMLADLHRCG